MRINYPKGIIKKENFNTDSIEFNENQLIDVKNKDPEVVPRTGYSFKGKSFYLSTSYDWIIVRDDGGSLCLVPFKKEY